MFFFSFFFSNTSVFLNECTEGIRFVRIENRNAFKLHSHDVNLETLLSFVSRFDRKLRINFRILARSVGVMNDELIYIRA